MKPLFILAFLASSVLVRTAFADSRLTNVSVRSTAGAGSDTLIVGFTISGSGSKQMLIRGIGPTLAVFSVAGPVADPLLRLFNQANTQIESNDDWGGAASIATAAASAGAFALPADSRDATLFSTLATGSYSAQVEAKSGTGIALVEAYDADASSSPSQISNLSARSLSGPGASVLTVGFSITGDTRKTVLIRAVGPSLTQFGVGGALANPQLRLISGAGNELGLNDDWLSAAGWGAAFTSVGAFALATNTRDAALLVSLLPGTYTAQASGVNNTSGVALIEVYDVSHPPASSFVLQPVENATPAGFAGIATDISRVTITPVVQSQRSPVYPFELRVAGITGLALIEFIVGVQGLVTDSFVVRTNDVRFGDSSLTAVRQWTFVPGRNAIGQVVPTRMQVPIIFSLN